MSSLVISGDTSGTVTLAAPAVAGTSTLTLQAATATSAVNTLGTTVASTSGTSIDFTGLPSWIKRITVMFNAVSTSGTSNVIIQIGSGSFTTSGYLGSGSNSTTLTGANYTTGFGILIFNTATAVVGGTVVLTQISGNTWIASGTLGRTDGAATGGVAGYVALSGTLDRVRITTVGGTDTFDAGTINILYEG
jgi:hypothetical protein